MNPSNGGRLRREPDVTIASQAFGKGQTRDKLADRLTVYYDIME